MNTNDNIQDELKELAPQLSKLKKENPFEVPAHYFQQLPGKVMEQVEPQGTASWWQTLDTHIQTWLDSWLKPRYMMPAFAMMLILIAGGHLFNLFTTTNGSGQLTIVTMEDIPEEALEEYVYAYVDEYDLAMLEDYSMTQQIDDETNTEWTDGISDEALEDYLQYNIDDLNISEALL